MLTKFESKSHRVKGKNSFEKCGTKGLCGWKLGLCWCAV